MADLAEHARQSSEAAASESAAERKLQVRLRALVWEAPGVLALELSARAANQSMMICVSRARGRRLVLDL